MIRRLKRSSKHLVKRSPILKKTYYRLSGYYHKLRLKSVGLPSDTTDKRETRHEIIPENIIWIFCVSRSGSTWLRSIMTELLPCKVWEEPKVGQLFGEFHNRAQEGQLGSTSFVMGNPTRRGWIKSLRNFVLDTAQYSNPSMRADQYLLVKEPDGAVGAPLLMEALPESRMILLVRDPRDVVASALDATRKGSWMYEMQDEARRRKNTRSGMGLNHFVKVRANTYLQNIGNAKKAYDVHAGRKILVRYEDLRADAAGAVRSICTALELPVSEPELARAVNKHSWSSIPDNEKGTGKFYRKGSAGGWREDLTPEQVEIIESRTTPLLKELYP